MKILIDTDWFSAIQDLQPSKQKEVLMAILNYPNGDSDTNLWKKTILPNLEKGKISYFNKLQNLKQNNPQKTNEKITESVSESAIGSVSESATDTTIREDKSREDINNIKNKFNINSIISVNGQDFIQFPPESMSLLKKYWTDSKIESIRKDLASMYPHETTVAVLLTKYESDKQKKKQFAPPTLDEWLEYSTEKGLKLKKMEEAYEAYEVAGWHDSQGKPILNWKQKILNVWCKDENREAFPTKPQTI